jgi:hypothetical protein
MPQPKNQRSNEDPRAAQRTLSDRHNRGAVAFKGKERKPLAVSSGSRRLKGSAVTAADQK